MPNISPNLTLHQVIDRRQKKVKGRKRSKAEKGQRQKKAKGRKRPKAEKGRRQKKAEGRKRRRQKKAEGRKRPKAEKGRRQKKAEGRQCDNCEGPNFTPELIYVRRYSHVLIAKSSFTTSQFT